jgi:Sulfotransferase domain
LQLFVESLQVLSLPEGRVSTYHSNHGLQVGSKEGNWPPLFCVSGKALMITIVSGLPRSGTSLMMQMLDAGGLPVLSDGERKADTDNPKGYLEWERIKQLPKDPSLIAEAEGKVVKVISQLILSLPVGHDYRIVFMQRPLPEVLKSQDEMLRRRGNSDSITETSAIEEAFQRHLIEVNKWLAGQPNTQVSRVHYHRVLREPKAVAEEVAAFLNVPLDIEAMVRQVDGSLYRNRMK